MIELQSASLFASESASAAATQRGRGTGVMFLAVFGTLWLLLGCRALFGGKPVVLAGIVIIGAALFLKGLSMSNSKAAVRCADPDAARRATVFRNVNLIQWGAIVTLLLVLNLVQRVEWITPGIMMIVGLHFLPLARLFRNKAHYLTGVALSVLAASYPLLSSDGPLSPVGPIAAGLILWLSAANMIGRVAPRPLV